MKIWCSVSRIPAFSQTSAHAWGVPSSCLSSRVAVLHFKPTPPGEAVPGLLCDVAVVDFVIMTCLLLPLPPTSKSSPTNVVVSLLRTYYGSVNKQGRVHHTSRPDTEIFQSLESFLSSLCGKRIAGLHWWATGRAHFPGKLVNGRCSLLTEPWTFLSIFTILGLGDNQRPLTTVLSPHLIPSLGDSALLLDSGYLFYLTLPS